MEVLRERELRETLEKQLLEEQRTRSKFKTLFIFLKASIFQKFVPILCGLILFVCSQEI